MTLLSQAKKKQSQERERLLDDAESRLKAVADTGDTWGHFCMARLCSVRKREEDCQQWLLKSSVKEYLAKAAKSQMTDFENVAQCTWFNELLQCCSLKSAASRRVSS